MERQSETGKREGGESGGIPAQMVEIVQERRCRNSPEGARYITHSRALERLGRKQVDAGCCEEQEGSILRGRARQDCRHASPQETGGGRKMSPRQDDAP